MDFKLWLEEAVATYEDSDVDEMRLIWDQTNCIHLLYLKSVTLFIDKSATFVDVIYLKYLCDLKLVNHYAWGAVILAHLYKELKNGCCYQIKHLVGYTMLFQA